MKHFFVTQIIWIFLVSCSNQESSSSELTESVDVSEISIPTHEKLYIVFANAPIWSCVGVVGRDDNVYECQIRERLSEESMSFFLPESAVSNTTKGNVIVQIQGTDNHDGLWVQTNGNPHQVTVCYKTASEQIRCNDQ